VIKIVPVLVKSVHRSEHPNLKNVFFINNHVNIFSRISDQSKMNIIREKVNNK
jgi:hypothetical protein